MSCSQRCLDLPHSPCFLVWSTRHTMRTDALVSITLVNLKPAATVFIFPSSKPSDIFSHSSTWARRNIQQHAAPPTHLPCNIAIPLSRSLGSTQQKRTKAWSSYRHVHCTRFLVRPRSLPVAPRFRPIRKHGPLFEPQKKRFGVQHE